MGLGGEESACYWKGGVRSMDFGSECGPKLVLGRNFY